MTTQSYERFLKAQKVRYRRVEEETAAGHIHRTLLDFSRVKPLRSTAIQMIDYERFVRNETPHGDDCTANIGEIVQALDSFRFELDIREKREGPLPHPEFVAMRRQFIGPMLDRVFARAEPFA